MTAPAALAALVRRASFAELDARQRARALRALDADALALGASPGGAADLLAAALFLDRFH